MFVGLKDGNKNAPRERQFTDLYTAFRNKNKQHSISSCWSVWPDIHTL